MSNTCDKLCDLTMIDGNSIDIILNGCDSEIKADIHVREFQSIRLWGQIKGCNGKPVPYALLKLVRVIKKPCGDCEYQGVSHSISDCQGFYQFDLCAKDKNAKYKILVSKAVIGRERIISTNDGNCNACSPSSYDPCKEYNYRITPPDKIECHHKGAEPSIGCNESQSYHPVKITF
ncbi:MAG: hypothetical protein RSB96_01255 [Oscillospiraceae bacterium]